MPGQNIYTIQQDIRTRMAALQRVAARLPPSDRKEDVLNAINALAEILCQLDRWFLDAVIDLL